MALELILTLDFYHCLQISPTYKFSRFLVFLAFPGGSKSLAHIGLSIDLKHDFALDMTALTQFLSLTGFR